MREYLIPDWDAIAITRELDEWLRENAHLGELDRDVRQMSLYYLTAEEERERFLRMFEAIEAAEALARASRRIPDDATLDLRARAIGR